MWETWLWSLGWEDPLEEDMAAQCSCLENPHEQRSLAGYSPRGHKQSDTAEWLRTAQHRSDAGEAALSGRKPCQPSDTVCVCVPQWCPTLCNATDCSLLGFSIHRILLVAIPFSRGSSWLRDWTWVSHMAGRFFTIWATRKPLDTLVIIVVNCSRKTQEASTDSSYKGRKLAYFLVQGKVSLVISGPS